MTMSATFTPSRVPGLTTVQMIEVDRAMIEDFRIELIQMMENAGRNLAHLARTRFLGGDPRAKRVIALAGGGGNGGGALVAARRLHNWGAEVTVGLAQSASDDRCASPPAGRPRAHGCTDCRAAIGGGSSAG